MEKERVKVRNQSSEKSLSPHFLYIFLVLHNNEENIGSVFLLLLFTISKAHDFDHTHTHKQTIQC